MGAVLFSDRGELLFGLDEYLNLQDARAAILTTRYPGANTNTSGGLYRARVDLFNPNNGDRPNVPNLAIIITDGKSTFDNDKTIPIAEDLRNDGVFLVAVGITNSVDENELKAISSLPQQRDLNYFTSPDFRQLEGIIDNILSSACVVTPPPTTPRQPPCKLLYIFYSVCLVCFLSTFLCVMSKLSYSLITHLTDLV